MSAPSKANIRAYEIALLARREYLRDSDPSEEESYIQDFRDSNISDFTKVDFFPGTPHCAGKGIAKSASSQAVNAWEVRRADDFLSLGEEGKKKVRRRVSKAVMEVYDTEALISALEYSNEQRGLLIEKIIRENVELKERLVSTQLVQEI